MIFIGDGTIRGQATRRRVGCTQRYSASLPTYLKNRTGVEYPNTTGTACSAIVLRKKRRGNIISSYEKPDNPETFFRNFRTEQVETGKSGSTGNRGIDVWKAFPENEPLKRICCYYIEETKHGSKNFICTLMNWKQLLRQQLDDAFRVAERLVGLLDEKDLPWKPSEGDNWMTTGQLLLHMGKSCGVPMKGFATGQWDMPDHSDMNAKKTEKKMPPPAGQLHAVGSIDEALKLLSLDKAIALDALSNCSEEDLESKPAPAPWDATPINLGLRMLQMVEHLNQHKAQLFYYLKMQGKPVNTYHLYGK